MLTAARHRPQLWPMSDTDYAWAAMEQWRLAAARKYVARSLDVQLQHVDLSSSALDFSHLFQPDRLQEVEDTAEDQSNDGDASDDESPKRAQPAPRVWAADPSVRVADLRNAISEGSVVELRWKDLGPDREKEDHPALVVKVLKTVLHIRWLVLLQNGVLIVNPAYEQDSHPIRLVSESLADVQESPASMPKPAGVPEGERWW
eukprot:1488962-Prymnesium_polylepis.1